TGKAVPDLAHAPVQARIALQAVPGAPGSRTLAWRRARLTAAPTRPREVITEWPGRTLAAHQARIKIAPPSSSREVITELPDSSTLARRKVRLPVAPVSPRDATTGLMVPALPADDGACRFTDDDLSAYGFASYTLV